MEAGNLEGMVIIGMDPSSYRNCGWAVVKMEQGRPVLKDKFTQEIKRERDDIGRYDDVYQRFEQIVLEHGAHALAVERSMGGGLSFVRNNLSETVGVVKLCCYRHGVIVHEVSPAHLKKVIADHGKATKTYIKKNVVGFFGLEKAGAEHECDAAAMALCQFVDMGWEGYVPCAPCTKSDLPKKRAKKTKKRAKKTPAAKE